jgi:hypothetical protein
MPYEIQITLFPIESVQLRYTEDSAGMGISVLLYPFGRTGLLTVH